MGLLKLLLIGKSASSIILEMMPKTLSRIPTGESLTTALDGTLEGSSRSSRGGASGRGSAAARLLHTTTNDLAKFWSLGRLVMIRRGLERWKRRRGLRFVLRCRGRVICCVVSGHRVSTRTDGAGGCGLFGLSGRASGWWGDWRNRSRCRIILHDGCVVSRWRICDSVGCVVGGGRGDGGGGGGDSGSSGGSGDFGGHECHQCLVCGGLEGEGEG